MFFCFVEVNTSNNLTTYWHVYSYLMSAGHIDMQVNVCVCVYIYMCVCVYMCMCMCMCMCSSV